MTSLTCNTSIYVGHQGLKLNSPRTYRHHCTKVRHAPLRRPVPQACCPALRQLLHSRVMTLQCLPDEIIQTQAWHRSQHLHVLVARADRSVSPRPQLLCQVTWQTHVGDADAEVWLHVCILLRVLTLLAWLVKRCLSQARTGFWGVLSSWCPEMSSSTNLCQKGYKRVYYVRLYYILEATVCSLTLYLMWLPVYTKHLSRLCNSVHSSSWEHVSEIQSTEVMQC